MDSRKITVRRALIAGATGAIGSELLRLLTDASHYSEIHCLGRREPDNSSSKIKAHIIDYDRLEALELKQPIDDAFCTLGTTLSQAGSVENFKRVDRDYIHQFGGFAQRLNVATFSVVSAIGANARSSHYYSQTKGETEALLQRLGLKSLRIFRPSLLHGERSEFRLKEKVGCVLLKGLEPVLLGALKKYRVVSAAQVAKAIYESAQRKYSAVKIFESDEIQAF
jgi:uncharacterized protein YbjT (DUF2867 family)